MTKDPGVAAERCENICSVCRGRKASGASGCSHPRAQSHARSTNVTAERRTGDVVWPEYSIPHQLQEKKKTKGSGKELKVSDVGGRQQREGVPKIKAAYARDERKG